MKINQLRLKDKKIYLIVKMELFNDENSILDNIAKELENGIQIIHITPQNVPTKQVIEIGRKIRELCSIYNAIFIINDRIDIAIVLEADGVFLEENSFSLHHARELLGENIIIGTNYLIDGSDYLLSDFLINEKETNIACFLKQSENNSDKKKIIYKKF